MAPFGTPETKLYRSGYVRLQHAYQRTVLLTGSAALGLGAVSFESMRTGHETLGTITGIAAFAVGAATIAAPEHVPQALRPLAQKLETHPAPFEAEASLDNRGEN